MQQGLVSFRQGGVVRPDANRDAALPQSGVHDDQVDSAAWNAIAMVAERQPPRKAQATRVKSWKDRLVGAYEGSHMAA